MPDLLLELRSEEIPARMQRKAAGDLRKLVTDGLVEAGLTYEAAREYWTPRRLALDIRGLTARSKDVREEKKGPSTKAPEQAVQGFLRSAGLTDISQAEIQSDPKKGDFYVARIVRPGRAAEDIIAALVPNVIKTFPWPKSMRWGPASGPKGMRYGRTEGRGGDALRWVRPLQSIVCTFGPETEEPVVVDFEVDGIRSGNVTYGHRFHAPGEITVRRFDDYAAKLEAAKVVIDAERRKQIILAEAKNLAFASGLDLVEDDGLLEEVSGLVEWPVVLMGEFEEAFLDIPAEVIRLTIRANQKCFVTRPAESVISPLVGEMPGRAEGGAVPPTSPPAVNIDRDGSRSTLPPSVLRDISPTRGEIGQSSLSNRFILTANIEAKDGGREIAHGNGKVVRARLSDALYFWKTDQADLPDIDLLKASAEKFGLDLRKPLDQRMARLDHLGVTFHAKLGTQGERVERIARLAEELAGYLPLEGGGRAKGAGGGEGGSFAGNARGGGSPHPGGFAADPPPQGEGGALAALAHRAAVLAKADLQTEVVGEFPELQGVMGRKYALLQGEHPSVAAAIEEHYKPQGPSDRVPTDPVSIAVALADKLDTLVGFWAIDEKPTGSKDPYALRRAALGVIRIVVENGVKIRLGHHYLTHALEWLSRTDDQPLSNAMIAYTGTESNLELKSLLDSAEKSGFASAIVTPNKERSNEIRALPERGYDIVSPRESWIELIDYLTEWVGRVDSFRNGGKDIDDLLRINELGPPLHRWAATLRSDLLSFFHDRLKVYLRDKGARHDLIDAVLASRAPYLPLEGGGRAEGAGGGDSRTDVVHPTPALRADPPPPGEGGFGAQNDDLLTIVRRVEALGSFLDTEDGKNLLAGTKRAANILAAEEKKGTVIAATIEPALLREDAEKTLFAAVNQAENKAGEAIQNEDFSAAMRALSALREPVDSFFEKVLVNDEDVAVRANRLALLARIRAATGQVADFSKIAG